MADNPPRKVSAKKARTWLLKNASFLGNQTVGNFVTTISYRFQAVQKTCKASE